MHTFSAITFYLTSVSCFYSRTRRSPLPWGGGAAAFLSKDCSGCCFTSDVKHISFLYQRITSAVCRTMLAQTTWKRLPKPFGWGTVALGLASFQAPHAWADTLMASAFEGGIAAKRFKGILVFDSQRFQPAKYLLKFHARIYSFCETWARGIPKQADD